MAKAKQINEKLRNLNLQDRARSPEKTRDSGNFLRQSLQTARRILERTVVKLTTRGQSRGTSTCADRTALPAVLADLAGAASSGREATVRSNRGDSDWEEEELGKMAAEPRKD